MIMVQREKDRDKGYDNSIEGDSRLRGDNVEGLILPLGENESAKIGEINLSVVLPTPPPKIRGTKSKGEVSKMHGMRTRRNKRKESEVSGISIKGEGFETEKQ